MKLGKIFICINLLILSLLMLTNGPGLTSYRFDEYNRTIVLDDGYVSQLRCCRNGGWL